MLKKVLFILPLLTIFALLMPNNVDAAKFQVGDYTLEKEEIVEDDLYVGGDNVVISGIVDGDLLVSGNNVTVDGTVTGDLYVAGNFIKVLGSVYGNTFAGGSDVVLNGTFGSNVLLGAMKADISGDINKDLTVGAWITSLSGNVGDDVRIGSGQVTSDAIVGGDFILGSDSYTVDENDVSGQLVIDTTTHEAKDDKPTINWYTLRPTFLGIDIVMGLVGLIGMFLLGSLLIYLAPVKTLQFEKKINSSVEEFVKSFAIGVLVLFVAPLPLFILLITFVGAPVALFTIGVLIFLTTFGTIWAEIALGNKVLGLFGKKDDRKYLSLLTGRVITVIIKLIPIIRGFYSFTLAMVTVGAVVRSKVDIVKLANKKTTKKK